MRSRDDQGEAHSPPGERPGETEFDRYAPGYDAGMEVGLKRLLGADSAAYIAVKVRWLLEDLKVRPLRSLPEGETPRLLDFGCGAGLFLWSLRSAGFPGSLSGCDVSSGMLSQARNLLHDGREVALTQILGTRTTYEDASFDLVVACAVFHHIPIPERSSWFTELARTLKPGGRLVVFEHNPLNPVTRWVVRRTEIDRNAILLRARELGEYLRASGLANVQTEYLMFFPPRFRSLALLERWLARLPLGAQFVSTGERPDRA